MKRKILKSILSVSLLLEIFSNHLLAQEDFLINGISDEIINIKSITYSSNINMYSLNLQQALEKEGYILSRVVHDQKNNIYVDLGIISNMSINGITGSNQKLIRRYVSKLLNKHIKVNNIDKLLTQINSIPGVSATFSFERNEENGTYIININAQEVIQSGGISIDSLPTKLGERNRVNINQNLYSLITAGDILRLQLTHVRGDDLSNQTSYNISYEEQIEATGGYWEVSFGDLKSKTNLYTPITGVTQNDYDGQNIVLALAYPLVQKHNHESFIIGQFENSKEETDNLGIVKINTFRASYFDLYHGTNGESIALGLTYSYGKHQEHYDNNQKKSFNHLRLGGGYITPIGENKKTEFRFEAFGQYGNKDVTGSELFFLGSETFLRGYQPGYFVGETGITSTIEIAHSFDINNNYLYRMTPYIFFDYGVIFNHEDNVNINSRPKKENAYSIGFGSKFYLKQNMFIESWIGQPLSDDYNNDTITPSAYLKLHYNW